MIFLNTALAASPRYRQTEPVSSLDPDYQAVLDYATANNIPLPDASQQAIDNQLIIDYKATGAWYKDDVFFKFKGTADPSFKLICWKRLIQATAYGGITWTEEGAFGNGTNAFIDSKFIPATDGVNYQAGDASIIYITPTPHNGTGTNQVASVYSGDLNSLIYITPFAGSNNYASLNGLGSRINSFLYNGLTGVHKVSDTTVKLVTDFEQTDVTSRGPTLISAPVFILARHRVDIGVGEADSFYNGSISYIAYGANKYTEHQSIKTALE